MPQIIEKQQLVIDWTKGGFYIFGALLLTSCGGGPSPIAPMPLPPLDAAEWSDWVDAYRPAEPLLYDLRWTYATQQGQSRGRGAIRFVPPDSVRFDYRGPFRRSGAAMIVGDSVHWVAPEDEIGALVEMTPLFWAMAGVPMPTPEGFDLTGLDEGERRIWRFSGLMDTLTFDLVADESGSRLRGQMRRRGELIGTVESRFGPAGGRVVSAEIRFPRSAALFSVTFADVAVLTEVNDSIWRKP